MSKVNSRKAIRMVAGRTFRYNRTRNLIGLLAICLTAVLFTAVFSIGMSALHSLQQNTMRQVGTKAHGGFKYLTMPQYEILKKDEKIRDISYNILLGTAENPELSKTYTEIRYTEEKSAAWSFSMPTTGRLPKEGRELATTVQVLDALGVEHRLGAEVPLRFTANGEVHEDVFTLCGFWSTEDVTVANQAFVSYEYAALVAPVWQAVPENFGVPSYEAGSVNPTLWFSTSFDIEGQMEKLKERCGFDETVKEGVNWAYAASEVDAATVCLMAGILLLIMLSAYLIIYNIFYISISRDIRFYGLLKTIGTTNRQLKKIVRRQAELLCLFGIPAGLGLGYLLSFGLVPLVMRTTTLPDYGIAFHPLVLVGGAAFTFITVMISCIKPCRYAAKVSPMEAIRYTQVRSLKKGSKKTAKITCMSMALDTMKRMPKKAIAVILSVSLSILLLNITVTFTRGFDMDKYLQNMVVSDFYITDRTVTSPISTTRNLTGVTPELAETVAGLDGVTETGHVYLRLGTHRLSDEAAENALEVCRRYAKELPEQYVGGLVNDIREEHTMISRIYGVDGIAADRLQITAGTFDREKFATGDYIVVSSLLDDGSGRYYDVGDRVTIDYGDRTKDYEVMAIGDVAYALSPQYSNLLDVYFIMNSDEFIAQTGERCALSLAFNVAEDKRDQVEEWVQQYCETTNPSMDYKSRSSYEEMFYSARNMYLWIGGILSFILGLIGILNFVNSMITSISAREHELATLQSIGMTGGQLRRMLICEGGCYAIAAALFTLTVGNVLSYLLVLALSRQMWFFTYHFTVLPILITLLLLAVISVIVPSLCYRQMCRRSITDRLGKSV